ncbi:MAG TPA: hypothetical protein VF596_21100 [Pyrinomonadaceae bacterium]|jgi:hypothetical protein
MKLNLLFLILCLLFINSCIPRLSFIKHNERLAAREATKFAEAAFVNRNYEDAYKLLPKETDASFTVDSLREFVANMHPTNEYPTSIKATDYEVIPGQQQVNVYLTGDTNGKSLYYLLGMIGTEQTGYKVLSLYRSKEGPYPNSPMRKPL